MFVKCQVSSSAAVFRSHMSEVEVDVATNESIGVVDRNSDTMAAACQIHETVTESEDDGYRSVSEAVTTDDSDANDDEDHHSQHEYNLANSGEMNMQHHHLPLPDDGSTVPGPHDGSVGDSSGGGGRGHQLDQLQPDAVHYHRHTITNNYYRKHSYKFRDFSKHYHLNHVHHHHYHHVHKHYYYPSHAFNGFNGNGSVASMTLSPCFGSVQPSQSGLAVGGESRLITDCIRVQH